jgi:hypothetical protein
VFGRRAMIAAFALVAPVPPLEIVTVPSEIEEAFT